MHDCEIYKQPFALSVLVVKQRNAISETIVQAVTSIHAMIQQSKKVGVVRQCFQAGPPVFHCKSLAAHTQEGNAKRNTSAFVEVSISHPSSNSPLIGSEMTVLA
jgi:hypothetical protein